MTYSHLSEDERDQIGRLRAAGQSMGAIARASSSENNDLQGVAANGFPTGRYSPLHAAEPMNCAGGVKHPSKRETDFDVFSSVIGWPRDGRPSRSPGG